jgi:hypothetical protein
MPFIILKTTFIRDLNIFKTSFILVIYLNLFKTKDIITLINNKDIISLVNN